MPSTGVNAMKKFGLLIAAALVSGAAGFVALPSTAHAGVCDQQGKRVQINGKWVKVVRVTTPRGTRLVSCQPW